MIVVSFDCALKSLGVVVVVLRDTIDIVDACVYDLVGDANAASLSIQHRSVLVKNTMSTVRKIIDNFKLPDERIVAVVEHQMVKNDIIRFASAQIIYEFCPAVIVVQPSQKNKFLNIKHPRGTKKAARYRINKKTATTVAEMLFKACGRESLFYAIETKYRDDVADALVQLFAVIVQ
jgi:hypothetical protein